MQNTDSTDRNKYTPERKETNGTFDETWRVTTKRREQTEESRGNSKEGVK